MLPLVIGRRKYSTVADDRQALRTCIKIAGDTSVLITPIDKVPRPTVLSLKRTSGPKSSPHLSFAQSKGTSTTG